MVMKKGPKSATKPPPPPLVLLYHSRRQFFHIHGGTKEPRGEGEKRSVKTPGDHRAMDAIGSIDWKRDSRISYTFTGDQGASRIN